MKTNLPAITFNLPQNVGLEGIEVFKEVANELKEIGQTAGTRSRWFEKRSIELHGAALHGKDVIGMLDSARDIRVVIHLWRHSDDFLSQIPVNDEMLNCFSKLREKPSTLILYGLVHLYFNKYDTLKNFDTLRGYILNLFNMMGRKIYSGELRLIQQNSEPLFAPDGPERVIQQTRLMGTDFETVAAKMGVPAANEGRFMQLCKFIYFIQRINNLNPGDSDPVFSEVVKPDIKESPYKDSLLLGHAVLKTMIDKCLKNKLSMPENWLQVILDIAGDPRLPKIMGRFQKWWSLLGSSYVRAVISWLSRLDLKFFLEALNDYAQRSGNKGLQRMFPSRKRFLEGLLNEGLVSETRLFIGSAAENYLRRKYQENKLEFIASLGDQNKSVIYLNIKGIHKGIHLIEGTHNFSIWIYDELPEKNPVKNFHKGRFGLRELGMGMAEQYWSERGREMQSSPPYRTTHHPNVTWQYRVIDAFRSLDVSVRPDRVLSRSDYAQYREKFGVEY